FIELLKNIINPSEKKNALWLEKFNNSISIHITPIDVKGIFSKTTASSDSMVFTSATMTTNGNFDYFKDLTGLKDIETRVFESPFNYEKNAVLHIPMGLPNPNEKEFFSSLVDYVYPAIKLNKGRTLFLTTSLNGVEQVANQFEFINHRNVDPLNILRQGMLPNQLLIEEFKSNQNSVLIGSFSFWEGIDLIGDNLTLLIIDKLPFKSPDDPIVDAKINLLNEKDFFMKSQIPMTTLLMKQGMGRLIRNFSDKGVAILGDNRIQKKYYGKQILKSLPPFQLVEDYNQVLNFIEELR
ncbi:MAG: ATP-dependent DNA helicase, partial [Betaproteobacteria bacterium]|nr:ATP-dependent DNA helicase [Betaproteobacteria bacterium]